MPQFWSYIGNDQFNIGCTGQTVYVYDKAGKELARFKDLIYAYLPVLSPRGDSFVVKTTEGRMAVYSLETLSLVKKFRYSKVDCAQDDGCCFSPDGSEFYNIERQGDDTKTALSVYDTADYSLKKRILNRDPDLVLRTIQFDSGTAYVLYFYRGKHKIRYYVAKLIDNELREPCEITERVFEFYFWYLDLAAHGFTDKAKEWNGLNYQGYDLSTIQNHHHTLAKLWEWESSRNGQSAAWKGKEI